MTHPVLAAAVADARNAGPASGPKVLSSDLAALDRPMDLLSNWDKSHALCDAFTSEYGFIQIAQVAQVQPSDADMAKWSALLRWVLQELTSWTPTKDPHQRILAAIFVAATMSDPDHELWGLLPASFSGNTHVIEALQTLLKAHKVAIDVPSRSRTPISTKEAIDRFAAANAARDWKGISEHLDGFGDYIAATIPQRQATRILERCGRHHLLKVLSSIDDALLAVAFVDAIGDDQACLELAFDCASPHFEFAAIRETLNGPRDTTPPVQPLGRLLVKISADPRQWRSFMNAFNRYPIGYPQLQEALGIALTSVSADAIDTYINAIHMQDVAFDDAGRRSVASCLRAFHARGSLDQRRTLWRLAYDRWAAWDFGKGNSNLHLLKFRASVLDYAIVGYCIECLGANGAAQASAAIVAGCLNLHQNWYESAEAMTADWHRSLSAFQPFGHAEHVLAGHTKDWLTETNNYLPDETQTDYLKLKYRMS